jgi:hypothetical protein
LRSARAEKCAEIERLRGCFKKQRKRRRVLDLRTTENLAAKRVHQIETRVQYADARMHYASKHARRSQRARTTCGRPNRAALAHLRAN